MKGSNIPLLRPLLDNGLKLDSRSINDALPIDRPFPVFTTTYCDADVRVSRDVDDNLYVYTKESDDTSLTSYDDVDADLGRVVLLELHGVDSRAHARTCSSSHAHLAFWDAFATDTIERFYDTTPALARDIVRLNRYVCKIVMLGSGRCRGIPVTGRTTRTPCRPALQPR